MEKLSIKDVVSIAGEPGLFRVVKADTRSIIVETLDETKKRSQVRGSMMASKLTDISMYTDTESEPLPNILRAVADKYGKKLPVDKKSGNEELSNFMESVLPNYDRERVYVSNIKKLVSWCSILSEYEMDFSVEVTEVEAAAESTPAA